MLVSGTKSTSYKMILIKKPRKAQRGLKTPDDKALADYQQQLMQHQTNTSPGVMDVLRDVGQRAQMIVKDPYSWRYGPPGLTKELLDYTNYIPTTAEALTKYYGNALLQGLGLVNDNESYYNITEKDLTSDEIEAFKHIILNNISNSGVNTGHPSYDDYINDDVYKPEYQNDTNAAKQALKDRGIVANTYGDAEGRMSQTSGQFDYMIDKDGNLILYKNYDFGESDELPETGVTPKGLYDIFAGNAGNLSKKMDKYNGVLSKYAGLKDVVKSRIPMVVNLGKASNFLSEEQMQHIPRRDKKFLERMMHVKKIDGWDMVGNAAHNWFGIGGGEDEEQPQQPKLAARPEAKVEAQNPRDVFAPTKDGYKLPEEWVRSSVKPY